MKTKTKKNVPMRMASVLLVATMLTACMTSGTFAKYTTSDNATDSARVAKFGVVVSADGTLYGQEYASGSASSANEIIAYSGTTNSGTVQINSTSQATGENAVAPGTKNSTGLGFGVSGTPEVDVTLTGSVSSENIYLTSGEYGVMVENEYVTKANYEKDKYYTLTSGTYSLATGDFVDGKTYYELTDYVNLTSTYYPVVYTLTGADNNANLTYNAGTVTDDSLAAIVNKISSSGSISKSYDANTDLSDATSGYGSAVLTWEWAYQNYTAANPSGDLSSFVDGVTYYTKNGDDYEVVADTSSGPATSTTYYTTTMYDGADTILGDLEAAALDATQSTNDFKGTVVKKNGDDYKAPTDGTDYNLTTSFNLSLTVTQVD